MTHRRVSKLSTSLLVQRISEAMELGTSNRFVIQYLIESGYSMAASALQSETGLTAEAAAGISAPSSAACGLYLSTLRVCVCCF